MNNKKIFISILASLSLGAIAGMLFAPKKGSHTRKIISDKGKEITDYISNSVNDLGTEMHKNYDKKVQQMEEIVSKVINK